MPTTFPSSVTCTILSLDDIHVIFVSVEFAGAIAAVRFSVSPSSIDIVVLPSVILVAGMITVNFDSPVTASQSNFP